VLAVTKPPSRPVTKAPGDAPADPKPAAALEAAGPEWMAALGKAALAEYAANPEGTRAAMAAYQAALEEQDRLRAALRRAETLMIMQRLAASNAPQPPPAGLGLRQVLATNLRVRMAELDMNQRQLSDQAPISERHLSQIMKCATGVTIDVVETLARALNTSPADLLTPRSGL
jgi:DNA-binding Xre family transcriptional regulator